MGTHSYSWAGVELVSAALEDRNFIAPGTGEVPNAREAGARQQLTLISEAFLGMLRYRVCCQLFGNLRIVAAISQQQVLYGAVLVHTRICNEAVLDPIDGGPARRFFSVSSRPIYRHSPRQGPGS
jgi:hypothetical protein